MVAGQLVLGAVVLAPEGSEGHLADRMRAAVPDFEVSVRQVHAADVSGMLSNCTVTIVGPTITGSDISALASTMAAGGANIVRIDRVADYPVTVLALEVLAPDPAALRRDLVARCHDLDVDVVGAAPRARPPRGAPGRHGRRLDPDPGRGHRAARRPRRLRGARSRAVTEAAMRGELDFAGVAARRGSRCSPACPRTCSTRCAPQIRLTPGARTTGAHAASGSATGSRVVSGGFTEVIGPLADELGIDYVARQRARGRRRPAHRPRRRRRRRPRRQGGGAARVRRARSASPPSRTIAIGDGANDLDMLAAAGLGHRLQRQAGRPGRPPTRRSTCPTSTRSCTCWASPARRSRRPTRAAGRSPPPVSRLGVVNVVQRRRSPGAKSAHGRRRSNRATAQVGELGRDSVAQLGVAPCPRQAEDQLATRRVVAEDHHRAGVLRELPDQVEHVGAPARRRHADRSPRARMAQLLVDQRPGLPRALRPG